MRKIVLSPLDLELFDADVSSDLHEFLLKHKDAFKRMWREQGRTFWECFLQMFYNFSVEYGAFKRIPGKNIEKREEFLEFALQHIRENFVEGKFSAARDLYYDIIKIADHQHFLQYLESKSYVKDPFYRKETKDCFRRLFGQADEKLSYLKCIFLFPLYLKYCSSVCTCLRRWLAADDINDEEGENYYKQLAKESADRASTIMKTFSESTTDDPTNSSSVPHFHEPVLLEPPEISKERNNSDTATRNIDISISSGSQHNKGCEKRPHKKPMVDRSTKLNVSVSMAQGDASICVDKLQKHSSRPCQVEKQVAPATKQSVQSDTHMVQAEVQVFTLEEARRQKLPIMDVQLMNDVHHFLSDLGKPGYLRHHGFDAIRKLMDKWRQHMVSEVDKRYLEKCIENTCQDYEEDLVAKYKDEPGGIDMEAIKILQQVYNYARECQGKVAADPYDTHPDEKGSHVPEKKKKKFRTADLSHNWHIFKDIIGIKFSDEEDSEDEKIKLANTNGQPLMVTSSSDRTGSDLQKIFISHTNGSSLPKMQGKITVDLTSQYGPSVANGKIPENCDRNGETVMPQRINKTPVKKRAEENKVIDTMSCRTGIEESSTKVVQEKSNTKIVQEKVVQEKSSTKVVQDKGSTTVVHDKGNTTVVQDKGSTKVVQDKGSTTVVHDKGSTTVVHDKSSTKVVQDKSSTKVVQDKSNTTVVQDKSTTKVVQDKGNTTVVQDKSSTTVAKDKSSTKVVQDKSSTKVVQDKSSTKVVQDKSSTKVVQDKSSTKVVQDKSSTTVVQDTSATVVQDKSSTKVVQDKGSIAVILDKSSIKENQEKSNTKGIQENTHIKKVLTKADIRGKYKLSPSNRNEVIIPRTLKVCGGCLADEPSPLVYKKCKRCKAEGVIQPLYYCSKECQVSDWQKQHKEAHQLGLLPTIHVE